MYNDTYMTSFVDEKEMQEAELYISVVESDVKSCLSDIYKLEIQKENIDKRKVKVKALEPPKFSGELRDYPGFKDDFIRIVEDYYGRDPFALRQCLSGDALRCVAGCENDYSELFRRLDDHTVIPEKQWIV